MSFPNEAAPAEKCLCEMLDAIETGLLQLRQERDQLRERLASKASPKPKPAARKSKATRSTASKSAPGKSAAMPSAAKTKTKDTQTPPEEPVIEAKRTKAPAKTRQALGRTLTQIRPRRESAP